MSSGARDGFHGGGSGGYKIQIDATSGGKRVKPLTNKNLNVRKGRSFQLLMGQCATLAVLLALPTGLAVAQNLTAIFRQHILIHAAFTDADR